MKRLKKGDKIYLDLEETKESEVNHFLSCRYGTVEVYEYRNSSGYGCKERVFLCHDNKSDSVAIIKQVYISERKEWTEESMHFEDDTFVFVKALMVGKTDEFTGAYSLVRD
tara:strand:- start:277 stop:609 length:333 start_codon:yes stop_codon:yes gene_type:complete